MSDPETTSLSIWVAGPGYYPVPGKDSRSFSWAPPLWLSLLLEGYPRPCRFISTQTSSLLRTLTRFLVLFWKSLPGSGEVVDVLPLPLHGTCADTGGRVRPRRWGWASRLTQS